MTVVPIVVLPEGVTAAQMRATDEAADRDLSNQPEPAVCVQCETCANLAQRLADNAEEQDQAMLAAATYDPDAPLPEGYERATQADLERLGLTDGNTNILDLEGHPDFHAEVFTRTDPLTGARSHVVGFRGTTDFIGQAPQNFGQGAGFETAYYRQADTIGRYVAASGQDVSFVGHSLGGGLASAASGASGLPAQTFNAAGLSDATLQTLNFANPANVRSTFVQGDILTAFQSETIAPDAFGTLRGIPPAQSWIWDDIDGALLVGGVPRALTERGMRHHGMESMMDSLAHEQEQIEQQMETLGCA